MSKKRILELYLNDVEMGERVYGAEAAARYYFHKSASELSTTEAALLAGCLPNPRVMNPALPNKRLRARQQMILARLKRWGYVAEQAVEQAPPPPAPPAPSNKGEGQNNMGSETETSATTPTATETTNPSTTETTETTQSATTTTESTTTTTPPP